VHHDQRTRIPDVLGGRAQVGRGEPGELVHAEVDQPLDLVGGSGELGEGIRHGRDLRGVRGPGHNVRAGSKSSP
jgi:hypothetical protein